MQNNAKTVAIIPARKGSKGLPGKNTLFLCGKPLIAYSIDVALSASRIGRVIVSTDCPEIAEIAETYGAEVPFLRPAELASDTALIGSAAKYSLDRLYGSSMTDLTVVTLYPTSPFRTSEMVDALIGKIEEGFDRVVTVKSVSINKYNLAAKRPDGTLTFPLSKDISFANSAQEYYRPVGLLEITKKGQGRGTYIEKITNKISLIDIDYLEDFKLAEYILSNNLFQFHE